MKDEKERLNKILHMLFMTHENFDVVSVSKIIVQEINRVFAFCKKMMTIRGRVGLFI